MSSASLDDWSSVSSEGREQMPDHGPSSPQITLTSEASDNSTLIRRRSNARTRPGPGLDHPEEDPQSLSVQTLREERPTIPDATHNLVEALEERIRSLESRLNRNGYLPFHESTEDGDGMERSRMSNEPQWLTWHEYCRPIKRASHILEVLIERPHTNLKMADKAIRVVQRPTSDPLKYIKRIRIRSHHIITALEHVTGYGVEDVSSLTLHQPFKMLLLYQKEIEAYAAHLEHTYCNRENLDNGDQCQSSDSDADVDADPDLSSKSQLINRGRQTKEIHKLQSEDIDGDPLEGSEKRLHFATSEGEQSPILPRHGHHDLSGLLKADGTGIPESTGPIENLDDSSQEGEAILHLNGLVTFMKEDMGPIFERHRLLRSSKATTVSFDELWHLFMPGDLVAGDDEQNPRLYRVCIVPPSDRYAKVQTVKEVNLQADGQAPRVEATQRVASIQCFNLDVFHFDYDGLSYGPVESRVTIIAFKGEKKIVDLPYYPVRFRKDAAAYREKMAQRGGRFMKLCIEETAHRDYEGLSAEEPQEHIDSQVIIDGNLGYRMHPQRAPKFGLKSFMEPSARVVGEACDLPGCHSCSDIFKNRVIFNDARIDRRKTFDFIRDNRSLLRTVKDSSELTPDHILLLPNYVQGFVLRSRQWYPLDMANIRPVHRHTEGFQNLILPDGVARLVEGLVQTHDPQKASGASGASVEPRHQIDLVRGKGQGLIILLHGAPGVGKTSTAECVAEYTQRPLFPITCGDLGDSAKEVEANLKQIFDLAHRWGCVLLLDEADVFLQARDKEDMRRNSVVSVFLRVLEYYKGILILTTNKVGFFDEAFTSRIHIALHYPPLSKKSTQQIWKMNLSRLIASRGESLTVDARDIKSYAKEHYKSLQKANRATWNGRQIKNVFQTAIALAEFDKQTNNSGDQGLSGQDRPVVLTRSHFDVVAKASEGFDDYLSKIHGGTDADRARRAGERAGGANFEDETGAGRRQSAFSFFPSAKKAMKKRDDSPQSSDTSSSEDADRNERKKSKTKKREKKVETSSTSSSEDDDEEEARKKRTKEREKKAKKEIAKLKEKQKEKANQDSSDDTSSEE